LTGTMTADMTWPEGDWRNLYFTPENLRDTLSRVDTLRQVVPEGMSLPELALRFILEHPQVATTIPGMRKLHHVAQNTAVSDGVRLAPATLQALRAHRWDRTHVIP